MKRTFFLYKLVLSTALCTVVGVISLTAQNLYFPPTNDTVWQRMLLDDAGFCESGLSELDDYLASTRTKAFILLKDGQIVHERYFESFTKDSIWVWNSAGKALTATLVGVAQEKGLLSIQDPSNSYLGRGWTSLTAAEEDQILIRHQLSMTTGLNDAVSDPFCTDASCLTFASQPDERWAYHNGPYTLLLDVVEDASGQNVNVFARQNIFSPIGMQGAYFQAGYNRIFVSNPRSFARFGLLMLAEGAWGSTQVLTDQVYFQAMIEPSQRFNQAYGYLWWLNGASSYMLPQSQAVFNGTLFSNASANTYAALGKDGQILLVDRSNNEVWIRMGEKPSSSGGFVPNTFSNEIATRIESARCGTSRLEEHGYTTSLILQQPVGSQLMLNTAFELASIEVFNLLGQNCANSTNLADSYLDVSDLKKGRYTAVAKLRNGSPIVEPFIKL